MKILFTALNYYPSAYGGVAISTYNIVEKLKSNFNIYVLTSSYKLPQNVKIKLNRWKNTDGVQINFVKTKHPLISMRLLLEGIIKIKEMDVLILSSVFLPQNIIFATVGIILNKIVIWGPHGELLENALELKSKKKYYYLKILKKLKIINKIIFHATSDEEMIAIKNVFNTNQIIKIENCIDIKHTPNSKKINQIIYLGRIHPIKRIETIIEAIYLWKKESEYNIQLIIAGEVDSKQKKYYHHLQFLINKYSLNEDIKFVGRIISPEKEIRIAESKLLCLVSDSENYGNVIVEALAQGTPVIASKGTPWAILKDWKCGLWINNDPIEILNSIKTVLNMNEEDYSEMCDNSKRLATEYDANKISNKWLSYLLKFE